MRPSPLMSSLLLILATGSAVAGGPDVRTVVVPQAEVRAGPSSYADCYPTNMLPRGSQVEVIHDAGNGWLAIKPPTGSFSWIDTRYVKQVVPTQPNFVVTVEGAGAPVLVGSWLRSEPPTKINAHLAKGTQVRQIGRIDPDRGQGSLMVIEPPLGELRYIRAEAVSAAPAPGAPVTGALTALSGTPRPAADPSRPPPTPDADTLWRQAEQAAARGRIKEAIQLYKLAGSANSGINPGRSEAAFRHARELEDALNGVRTPADALTPAPQFAPGTPGYPPNARGPAFRPAVAAVPVGYSAGPAAASLAAGSGTQQTWRGKITHASRLGISNHMYVLEATYPQKGVLYLTSHGVDLSKYLNKEVEVSGTMQGATDTLRSSYMIVMSVQLLP